MIYSSCDISKEEGTNVSVSKGVSAFFTRSQGSEIGRTVHLPGESAI